MASRHVAAPAVVEQGLYIAYAALATMAIVPIYFGSFASLKKWKNPKEKIKTIKRQIGESDESDADMPSEPVSQQDAYTFLVFGSAAFYGLYLAYTQLEKSYVNYVLTAYFGVMGALAMAHVGVNTLSAVIKLLGLKVETWHVNFAKKSSEFYSAKFTIVHLFMLVVSVLLSGYYVATKSWIASNIFAISFALNAIQLLSLDSFKAGLVLLIGLTAHDLVWVRSTEVMATVAKNFDGPLKVIFPRLLLGLPAGQAYKFATLSLGDIVIPGLFAALCLRFDQHRAGTRNPELGRSTQFRKPYFTACFVAYILGLSIAFYMAHVFKFMQPALLYVSPTCILSMFMTAAVRGEMKQVFAYLSEEGLEAARIKKEAREKKSRLQAQARARAQASRYPPRVNRLPNVIKEESFVSTARSYPEPASSPSAGENKDNKDMKE
ncbi:signal peptide peptidase-domain-containing protein [Gamsiella multidivaricata]|uniref:signal peptide peptidase-domain-containing protein n=1 Tax=Gamsiella multidivaricata TaxID=101098 RepID=UPI002220747E|nr:signal peptide peptidase-domain-containing protein [Gamsiella multidivaricata]KAG0354169.1 hypothetical protein BGZ54_001801 [Gamsiella multidivaricata]KAI7820680.1 signal peptide peptidase-domain-containing protein [Gamsiella multidivaricata]